MKKTLRSKKFIDINNAALRLQSQGELTRAEGLLRQLVRANPTSVLALYNLGCLYLKKRDFFSATSFFVNAINICGFNDDIFFNLNIAIASELSRPRETEAEINRIQNNSARSFFLAILYFNESRYSKALNNFSKCLELVVHQKSVIGNIFFATEKLQSTSRLRYFENRLKHYHIPDVLLLEALFATAITFGQEEKQINLFKKVSTSQEISDLGRICCAKYLIRQRKLYEAMTFLNAISPNSLERSRAQSLESSIQLKTGNAYRAIELLEQILVQNPDSYESRSNLIFAMDLAQGFTTVQLQEQRRLCAATLQKFQDNFPRKIIWDGLRRLRVGYVSGDFFRHSASKVFGHLVFFNDPEKFDVFCYSNRSQDDDIYTKKFKENSSFTNIAGLSDSKVIELIRNDELDILVDLSGYSSGNRLPVFAQRCAPIQISAWGYIGGTGLREMDYIVADDYLIPPEEQELYTESVIYAPRVVSYHCLEEIPNITNAPSLSSKIVTFGSFNRPEKIGDNVISIWSKILNRVPQSMLFIKSPDFDDPDFASDLRAKFAAHGIAIDRIIFGGGSPWFDHLTAFRQVDISLDPFPHGGGVTTIESLMMGVPVVSLAYPTIIGRLSASILSELGLVDWVAENEEQYIEIACKMASNLDLVADMRLLLREKFFRSIFGSSVRYVRFMEAMYLELVCLKIIDNLENKEQEYLVENKALSFIECKRYRNAISILNRLVLKVSNKAEIFNTLGVCFKHIGDYSNALKNYRRAIEINPKLYGAHNNIGLLFLILGKDKEAEEAFQMAISVSPKDCADPLNNLGVLYRGKARYFDSLLCFNRAVTLKQDSNNSVINMCGVLREVGNVKDSVAGLQNIVKRFPGDERALTQLIFGLDLLPSTTLTDAFRIRKQLATTLEPMVPKANGLVQRKNKSKVHVGYVSGDFRHHSAAKVFGGLVSGHDRSKFMVSCFANQPESESDNYTAFFRSHADNFLFVKNISDDNLIDTIYAMGVDILVDLSCITHGNRLKVFTAKPARVQLSGWGYPGGCGISQIDLVVVDDVLLPPADEINFPAKFLRLKSALNYFCIDPLPGTVSPPFMSKGYVTYGSFNRISKISDICLEVWSEISRLNTTSRFVFKSAELSDERVKEYFLEKLMSFGFESSRISLFGGTSWFEHMSTFNSIDLSLDPFPHGGGVSTLESIIMGVPVLTLRWPSLVGRLGTSILVNAGMEDFIFEDSQLYIEKALRFPLEINVYASLRGKLRHMLSSSIVFNKRDYVNDVEKNYFRILS